ncbi:14984_t:CDS:2, partial [Racocetra fulgida]
STVLNDSATPDITQMIEVLRFVCYEMGLLETGQKQEIVSRLIKESHNRLGPEDFVEDVGVTRKAKEAQPQLLRSQNDTLLEELEALSGTLLIDDIERKSVWTKRKLTKQRNQCEYNEWCRAEVLMDKVLASGDMNYICIARQVTMKRAYVVRVDDKDSWEVATKMANTQKTKNFSLHSDGSAPAADTDLANRWDPYSTNSTGVVVCSTNGFSATVLGCN